MATVAPGATRTKHKSIGLRSVRFLLVTRDRGTGEAYREPDDSPETIRSVNERKIFHYRRRSSRNIRNWIETGSFAHSHELRQYAITVHRPRRSTCSFGSKARKKKKEGSLGRNQVNFLKKKKKKSPRQLGTLNQSVFHQKPALRNVTDAQHGRACR